MATQINRIPFNAIPKQWAFDRELGSFIRDLLNILWQQRERSGGDDDAIASLIARVTTAETDILALEAADVAIDARLDALEAAPGVIADVVEHDFGTAPVYEATFTITDASIAPTSIVTVVPGGAATDRTADDWQWDGASIGVVAGTGSATCYVTFSPGPIVGPRAFNYMVI